MPNRYPTPRTRAYRKTVHEDSRWKQSVLREEEINLRDMQN